MAPYITADLVCLTLSISRLALAIFLSMSEMSDLRVVSSCLSCSSWDLVAASLCSAFSLSCLSLSDEESAEERAPPFYRTQQHHRSYRIQCGQASSYNTTLRSFYSATHTLLLAKDIFLIEYKILRVHRGLSARAVCAEYPQNWCQNQCKVSTDTLIVNWLDERGIVRTNTAIKHKRGKEQA